jgi:hypothetical protein
MMQGALLPRLRVAGVLSALIGITVCALFAARDLDAFWRAHLTAFFAWHTVPLGCLALLLTYHLTGGPWGRMLGESLEAGARTMPLIAVLGLPLLLDLGALFPWAHPEYLAREELVAKKVFYLNPPFFMVRTVFYLAVWTALAFLITDARAPLAERPRQRALGAIGAIVFALTTSFAAIDWAMSLDPKFNSSTFGLIVIGGHLSAGLCFAALITLALARARERPTVLAEAPAVGLGGLLQGAILLWAYLVFMEYLVVWSGDLPHNAKWYLVRAEGGWEALIWIVALGHFVLPFLVLLSERMRHDWRVVASLAALVLATQLLYLVWQTAPAWEDDAPPPTLIAGALLAIGGLWLFLVALNLGARRRVLIPREQVSG